MDYIKHCMFYYKLSEIVCLNMQIIIYKYELICIWSQIIIIYFFITQSENSVNNHFKKHLDLG